MRVFVTGITGWIGSLINLELLRAGHQVVGLVRSPDKAAAVAATGATPLIGSLSDLDVLREGGGNADGVIHTAFGLDLSRIDDLAEEDRRAVETFGDVLAGSDRPLLVTDGFYLTPPGVTFTEDRRQPEIPGFPRASATTAFEVAEKGVHASVVRNPRSVHGEGERHGFVPMLSAIAREKGASAYVGDGQNLWPSVHRQDAARLYRLALERGARGETYHNVAEEGVPYRQIAEAIGRQTGVPAVSMTPEEAEAHFGAGMAMWVGGNGPASSTATREALGWTPVERGLISDIDRPEYLG